MELENNVVVEDSNTPANNEPQLSAAEEKAMDQGWVPQDQWEGDPDQWRPAKEFLDRGELFKKIEDQNRTIKEFKRALDDLKGHHAKTRETEYARALATLKQQKRTALEEGDAAAVIQLDDEIDHIDGNKSNNKIENLRAVKRSQNQWNAKIRKDSTSGVKGVLWHKRDCKWAASIRFHNKSKSLGCYDDLELAELVVQEARILYHGEYARNQ